MRSLICAALTLAATTLGAPAQESRPLMIGVSEPLTGVNAFYGQQARWGAELAIREANAAGGIRGRPLRADYQDNACNPAEGVKSVSQMLGDRKYLAIVDGGCSSVALAVMPLVERAEVPFVVANPSASAIAERSGIGGNRWTFKVNPSDATMLTSLVDWLVKEGTADRVAVLGEDTDYGRGGAAALKALLEARGKTMLAPDFFQKGTTDFSVAFARIKAAKPDRLAIFAIGADTANFVGQWFDFGGGIPLTGRIQIEQIPAQIAGSPVFDRLVTVQPWDMAVDLPANAKFIADYKALAKMDPTVNAWDAYEAVRTLVAAIDKAGPDPTPKGVRDALETVSVPAMFGGEIAFDKNHLAHINAVVLSLKNGKTVVLGMSRT